VKGHLARGRARLLEINGQARPFPDARPGAVPDPVKAHNLIDGFRRLIQERKSTSLDAWISEETSGSVASFAMGTAQDHAAVRAGLTERWSNGQIEGRNFRTWRMATTRRVAE
jgi:transposase